MHSWSVYGKVDILERLNFDGFVYQTVHSTSFSSILFVFVPFVYKFEKYLRAGSCVIKSVVTVCSIDTECVNQMPKRMALKFWVNLAGQSKCIAGSHAIQRMMNTILHTSVLQHAQVKRKVVCDKQVAPVDKIHETTKPDCRVNSIPPEKLHRKPVRPLCRGIHPTTRDEILAHRTCQSAMHVLDSGDLADFIYVRHSSSLRVENDYSATPQKAP